MGDPTLQQARMRVPESRLVHKNLSDTQQPLDPLGASEPLPQSPENRRSFEGRFGVRHRLERGPRVEHLLASCSVEEELACDD